MNTYFNYNKIKLIAVMVMLLSFSSCLKKDNIPEISKVQPVIEFPIGGPGLAKNTLSAFSTDLVDTVIALNIASPDPLSKDVIVTIKNDPAVVADYNSSNGTSYVAPSAAQVEIASTQITIKAGYRVGFVKAKIKFPLFDPTKDYMLGLSITDAQGMIISGNFGKFLWAFVVKNPLAGTYLRNFNRWNDTPDTTTAPNSTVTLNVSTSVPTVTGNSVFLPESYLQSFVGSTAGVTLSFNTTGGVLGNFSVTLDASTLAGLAAGGFTIITTPKLVGYTISGNAGNLYAGSSFRIYMVVQNSAGGIRRLVDNFVKL